MDYTTRYLAVLYSATLRRTCNQSAEVNMTMEDLTHRDWATWNNYNPFGYHPSGPLNATKPPPVMGTATDWTGSQRVVQSKESTAVLVVLLSALLVLHSAAGMRRLGGIGADKDVLREDPGTIAAMARLLKGSNVFEYYAKQEEQWRNGEIVDKEEDVLGGKRLRLGFFGAGDDGKGIVYGLRVVHGDKKGEESESE